jgi:uncharacterized protein YcaQ
MELSPTAARALMLAAQGLHERPPAPATKADVLDTIRRMGVLQIDSISVIARSPYLVLWSRIGSYEPSWLDELLEEGKLFEYWAHAACFIPAEDFNLYRQKMAEQEREGAGLWLTDHSETVERILHRVKTGGAVRAADFERSDGRKGTWWDRKPEKVALEVLFNAGLLMIARRENFQRIYDLRERVMPGWGDTETLSNEEIRREMALKAVKSLGVALPKWVPDYFRIPKKGIITVLEDLEREGDLLRARIEGWDEPAFVHRDHRGLAEQAASGELRPTLTTLLSPFDPLVWDRARARELFGFDYRIEVYTPMEKRRYGYFTTPILNRGELIGRLDPKAHRKDGVLEVKAIHLEPGVQLTDERVTDLRETLRECAEWHRTPDVVVRRSDPPEIAPVLSDV